MSNKYVEAEAELAEKVVKLFENQGFNPTMMRVYITLFLSTRPLGLTELSKATGYSVSTVCNIVEILERTMDVRKFKQPGSKKIYFECAHDLVLIHRKKMEASTKEAQSMIGILKEAEELLKDDKSPEAVMKREYIIKLRTGYEQIHKMCHKFESMIEAMR